jgi:hypothetical protein
VGWGRGVVSNAGASAGAQLQSWLGADVCSAVLNAKTGWLVGSSAVRIDSQTCQELG